VRIYNRTKRSGCPRCSHSISKPSQAWLDMLDIPDDSEHREVCIPGTRYRVDGFDPATGTVYEFHGDNWHGNPAVYADPTEMNRQNGKTMGELQAKTKEREDRLRSLGYRVVVIYQKDWNHWMAPEPEFTMPTHAGYCTEVVDWRERHLGA